MFIYDKIISGDNMKLIVCLDDNNGMMFNKRRQSRDKNLIADILELCRGKKLYINSYSSKLFPENTAIVTDNPENDAADSYCFAENFQVNAEDVSEIIVYKWNRLYPADTYFNIDLENWILTDTAEFKGTSHDKITREIYTR